MKTEKKKCLFCEKRYAVQQNWKTEEEKKFCFTCYVTIKYITNLEKELTRELHDRGIKKRCVDILFPLEDSTKKLLQAVKGTYLEDKII